MGSFSHLHRGDRKAILRDVYEHNVRETREEYGRAAPAKVERGSREGGSNEAPRRRPAKPEASRSASITATGTAALTLVLILASALAAMHLDAPSDSAARDSVSTAIPANLAASNLSGSLPLRGAPVEIAPINTGNGITSGSSVTSGATTGPNSPSGSPLATGTSPSEGAPSIANLYGLHLETIVIDAGHGGVDPGTVGQQGLQEKDVTLDVARRLKQRLERHPGYRILLTRDGEQTMDLRSRIEFANEQEADLFVSIHVNWLPVDSIAPIETYYYGPNSDARALRLAQRENRNSGYSLAEFNDLTRRLGVDLKIQESSEAAHSIQEGLVDGLRSMGRDISDWGAKSGDFMVLLGVEAPSVLAEIGSLSNHEEESKLLTVSYRERLAYILEEGITNYLEIHENPPAKNGQEDKEGV